MHQEESPNGTTSTIFNNQTKVLTFRCLFLLGEGHVASKVIERASLAECQRLKNVSRKDLEPILKMSCSSEDMLRDCLEMLLPSVLLRDESGDLFLVHESSYWW
jgi:hypothetical protein